MDPISNDVDHGGLAIEMIAIPDMDFEMGKTEVTQVQWRAVMGEIPCGMNKSEDDSPVENVSWDDAKRFITRLNEITGKEYRLPSEAEWKFACLAGRINDADGPGVEKDISAEILDPVPLPRVNAFGLHDLPENVWEWVEDQYDTEHNRRVLLGGSWFSPSREVDRIASNPATRFINFGFRLARTLP